MELLWVKLRKTSEYALFISIGESGDDHILLKSSKVPDAEVRSLRRNVDRLDDMSTDKRLQWIKDKMPTSYKNAFRKIPSSEMSIAQNYTIKS